MLNELVRRVQLHCWVQVHLDATLAVNDPLAKVPRQLIDLSWPLYGLKLSRVSTEPFEDVVRVRSIDHNLVHEWETHSELLYSHFLYLLIRCQLLVEELAAREAYDLQACLLVSVVQLDHLSVVALGEGSLGCDIGDQKALLALHEVSEHELVQVDVLDKERPQLANVLNIAFVLSLFPRRPEANASLSISHGAVAVV